MALTALILGACGSTSDVADPDVQGIVLEEYEGRSAVLAQGLLEEIGLAAELVDVIGDEEEPGVVIEQIPAAGNTVREGSTVVLRVAVEMAVVPDVRGLIAAEAVGRLESAGYAVNETSFETLHTDAGTVVNTDPVAGTELEDGSMVVLRVAVAPAPDPEPEPDPRHTVRYRQELWEPSLYYASDHSDACEGRGSYTGWGANQTVALIGPDGNELSSALLDVGRLEASSMITEDIPPAFVCAFEVEFTGVPEVATYSVRHQSEFDSTFPSVSLDSMRLLDWSIAFYTR